MTQHISARDKYKPEKISVLFIAESPPASGGYFYFEEATGRSGLFVETMKALGIIPEGKGLPKGYDKRKMLEAFKAKGFFVLDVSYEPVNTKSSAERRYMIKKEIPRLMADVKKLNPKWIVVVKSSLFLIVRDALEKAGFGDKILNQKPLLFPSHGNQKTYRRELKRLIERER